MTKVAQITHKRMAMNVGGSGRGLFCGSVWNLLGETKEHHEEHQTVGNYIKITLVTASSTAEMKEWWSDSSIAS
jgi:hypothetical protein